MSQALGKVTGDLDAERGPDVTFQVTVERSWFGRSVTITPSRNVHCAACEGGGCDRCGRAGAVSLWERGEPPEVITVTLPDLPDPPVDLCLRLPDQGGRALAPEVGGPAPQGGGVVPGSTHLARGHLLLIVRPGDVSDPQVVLNASPSMSEEARQALMKRSIFMAAALILLFFGMLKLSGWL